MREGDVSQAVKVGVVCYDVFGIGNDCTVNELVVIWIGLNQPEAKLCINTNRVVCPQNCRNDKFGHRW